MPTAPKIRILVADDQEVVRSGVKALLTDTEIEVVAEAACSQAAVKLALEKDFDVLLLDVRMPDGDGLTALGRIKLDRPDLPVLLFSAFDNPASVARAIAPGGQWLFARGLQPGRVLERDPSRSRGPDYLGQEEPP
jgi:DNA-binding NarL/FixJ family response regulator